MKKIFLTFIVFAFVHIVFAQNRQTVVVRPETNLEKTVREANDVAGFINALGEFAEQAGADRLNKIKNSRYSVFVEKKLEVWKNKGVFEKTADWQKRLNDSTAIKKAEIYESALDEFVQTLNVLNNDNISLNGFFYNSEGRYDADKEVLIVNTFWGNIPILIPLDEARNMGDDLRNLSGSYGKPLGFRPYFFIQNDQLALLTLTFSNNSKTYTWENPSPSAQIFHNKRRELEQIASRQELEDPSKKGNKTTEGSYTVSNTTNKQDIPPPPPPPEIIVGVAEIMPQFPGGEDAMFKFFGKELVYPDTARKANIQGRVQVSFVVGTDGSLSQVKLARSSGNPSLDEEAIRVSKKMPKWIAGKQNGNPVKVRMIIPILFRLEKEEVILEMAEIMPQFPGGEKAMLKFLSKEIVYPTAARKAKIQGDVLVSCIVGTDGTLSQIKIARSGPDPSLDEEAVRAVKKMPKWIAGKQNGNPVKVRTIIPVVFRLAKN